MLLSELNVDAPADFDDLPDELLCAFFKTNA